MSAAAIPRRTDLPIFDALPALRAALAAPGLAVLAAPPGSGKTTGVPLQLLDEPWLAGRRIVMLEPRRIAARAAAARMAQLRGEPVGATVGYQIRYERRIGAATRIEVVTEGLLTRRLQSDAELPGVGLLIFDEFHERSLQADLSLALALEARDTLRPDLRILVMSATLDVARVAALLGGAPVIESTGRSFAVDIRYRPVAVTAPQGVAVAAGVRTALAETAGDVLAFLPGGREIREAQRALVGVSAVHLLPLYGELSSIEQDAALRPSADGRRKVILATNIAQTSLTVEGVTAVVDGGYVRVARYDLGAGADRLLTQRVSRASADQRAGRAGRLGPGVAYRLWSQDQHGQLPAHDTPEILAADLSRLVLELAAWGLHDPTRLALLDMPPVAGWQAACELLQSLQALDRDGRITSAGRALLRLPLPPRQGHLLLQAQARGLVAPAAWVAALLDARGAGAEVDLAQQVARHAGGDVPAGGRHVAEAARQLLRLMDADAGRAAVDADAVGRIVAFAYPERLARRRGEVRGVFLCADGAEARVDERDALAGADWLAVAHWTPGVPRRIRLAARIDEAEVLADHAARLTTLDAVRWDAQVQGVIAERSTRLGALVLQRQPWRQAPLEAMIEMFLQGLRGTGADALPWSDAARDWQARVASIRLWRPAEDWPAVDDAALMARLEEWLAPHLDGITRLEHLARLDLAAILATQIDYAQQQRLARLAPSHLSVPSGSRPRLQYAVDGSPPVLAVKLQELFGLSQTPSVDDGRRPVMLHLLSPARRPIQVTQDLAGFWSRTYPDVKKELKGRYPRHPWPDDPLTAVATARATPRPR